MTHQPDNTQPDHIVDMHEMVTDTNQASVLLELCKEVYEKTGWEAPETYKAEDGNPENDWQAYDTDYLLEKLPQYIRHEKHDCRLEVSPTGYASKYLTLWAACYVNDSGIHTPYIDTADTPLKALLKLVIALDDAGVNLQTNKGGKP